MFKFLISAILLLSSSHVAAYEEQKVMGIVMASVDGTHHIIQALSDNHFYRSVYTCSNTYPGDVVYLNDMPGTCTYTYWLNSRTGRTCKVTCI